MSPRTVWMRSPPLKCVREDRECVRAERTGLEEALAEAQTLERSLREAQDELRREREVLLARAANAEERSAALAAALEQMKAAEECRGPVAAAAAVDNEGSGVVWKTNFLPESQTVVNDVAGQLAHAAADITSVLATELGALRKTSGGGQVTNSGAHGMHSRTEGLPSAHSHTHTHTQGQPLSLFLSHSTTHTHTHTHTLAKIHANTQIQWADARTLPKTHAHL